MFLLSGTTPGIGMSGTELVSDAFKQPYCGHWCPTSPTDVVKLHLKVQAQDFKAIVGVGNVSQW